MNFYFCKIFFRSEVIDLCARKLPIYRGDPQAHKGNIRRPASFITLIFIFIAILGILIGLLGYKYYDSVISKNMPVFFCVIPAAGVTIISIVIAILVNRLRIRKVNPFAPASTPAQQQWIPPELAEKNRVKTIETMKRKRTETSTFLKDLREQREEGLLSEKVYTVLNRDYSVQLKIINNALEQLEKVEGPGGTKMLEEDSQ